MSSFEPIGFFRSEAKYAYDVPRQGILAKDNTGEITLLPGRNFETALEGLEGFSRIWVLFVFDRNGDQWHPKVQPPRHLDHKVGVFATRSPYRPNPIGLSCVELLEIRGRTLVVRGHDLLDGTPILDVKPYLPYADSFPEAAAGWTDVPQTALPIAFTKEAEAQIAWLAENGVPCLRDFIVEQLSEEPLNPKRHRLVKIDGSEELFLAYRTWRVRFKTDSNGVEVMAITSGYSVDELASDDDKYHDKALHRLFKEQF